MKAWVAAAYVAATSFALGACAWAGWPWLSPTQGHAMIASGAQEVVPPQFHTVDQLLAQRAPGWGHEVRRQVAHAITDEAARAGLDPLLVLAVIAVESEFQEQAVSPVGAKGLMQIRPSTLVFLAEKEGLKLPRAELERDQALCVRLGVRYLASLHQRFGGDLDLALMAYNMGPGKLIAQAKKRELEPYRGYPRAVRAEHQRISVSVGQGGTRAVASSAPAERAIE